MSKLVSQKECKDILKHVIDQYYHFSIPIKIRFAKRVRSWKKEQKEGLGKLVYSPVKDPYYFDFESAEILVTDSMRKEVKDVFYLIGHELQHIQDILEGKLKFKGSSIIYCGKEYKLKHIIEGPYDKIHNPGYYVHGNSKDYGYNHPWEAFADFNRAVSYKDAERWIAR